jgi:mannosyltransferase
VRADLSWRRHQRRPLTRRRLVPRVAAMARTWTTRDRVAAVAFALVGLAMAIDLFRLADMSVWGDEAFSIGLASLSWPELWRYAWTIEVNMVLYHALLKGWLDLNAVFGIPPVELVVRLPSVAFGALAVLVVFWTGRRFWGATVGVVAAVLLLLNHVMLLMSRYTRSYTLEVFLVCLGSCLLLVALTAMRHRARWWAAYALVMTAALYAHLFSGLVVAAHVVAFTALLWLPTQWRDAARRSLRPMAICLVAISVAALPLLVFAATHGSPNLHVPPSSPYEVARALWNIAGHSVWYGLLLAGATTAGLVFTLRARRTRPRSRAFPLGPAVVLCSWLAVPFALAYVASQPRLNLHLFAWGYLVVVVPALCLLAGVGAAALPRRLARFALAMCLVVAAALAIPEDTFAAGQDFRTAEAWIAENYQARDGLICSTWSCALSLTYYDRLGRVPTALLDASPVQWSWTRGAASPLDLADVRTYARAHPRIFFVESVLDGDLAEVKVRAAAAREWLDDHYALLADIPIASAAGPVRVRLYADDR